MGSHGGGEEGVVVRSGTLWLLLYWCYWFIDCLAMVVVD